MAKGQISQKKSSDYKGYFVIEMEYNLRLEKH